ncbi:antirepressor AbbA [Fictibacillus iocasae]|uniref:Antirepressor AbbA n=1 Tax=Fictibacillus iocasae TaxID=2715437 RepID=A0ABW2NRU7_9BACL
MESLRLTEQEKEWLVEAVVNQRYALEIVDAELTDLENGNTSMDEEKAKNLYKLYKKLHNSRL